MEEAVNGSDVSKLECKKVSVINDHSAHMNFIRHASPVNNVC